MRQFYYVDTLTSTLLDGDSICQTLWIICQMNTIHNRLRKKKLSRQCEQPFKGQTMTRRHTLAYVQWARRHFIWRCVNWSRVSFSGETRFALSHAGCKTHKQAFLGLLHAGKASIWWGQFRGLSWKKWVTRRRTLLSC